MRAVSSTAASFNTCAAGDAPAGQVYAIIARQRTAAFIQASQSAQPS